MKSGNVAEKVKNLQTGQQKQEFPYRGMPKKRSTSALDGVAEPPPAKRMAVQKDPPPAKRTIEGFPKSTLSAMLPSAKCIGDEPVAKRPPRVVNQPVPKKLSEDLPPAPPSGAPAMPQREPPKPPPSPRSAPDGDAAETTACPSAAAVPAYEDKARFAKPTPPKPDTPAPQSIQTAVGPAYLYVQQPARGDPANLPTREPPQHLKEQYKMGATPDVDRGQPQDAATQRPQWAPPLAPSRPPIMQFVQGCFYQHARLGQVRFLSMTKDEYGRSQCHVMQWNDKRSTMTEFHVLTNEMMVTENLAETGQATGVAADPTDITRPRRMYYVDAPINDDQPYVRQDDAELISGTVLQATANYKLDLIRMSWRSKEAI